jgi:hypothetical protein
MWIVLGLLTTPKGPADSVGVSDKAMLRQQSRGGTYTSSDAVVVGDSEVV